MRHHMELEVTCDNHHQQQIRVRNRTNRTTDSKDRRRDAANNSRLASSDASNSGRIIMDTPFYSTASSSRSSGQRQSDEAASDVRDELPRRTTKIESRASVAKTLFITSNSRNSATTTTTIAIENEVSGGCAGGAATAESSSGAKKSYCRKAVTMTTTEATPTAEAMMLPPPLPPPRLLRGSKASERRAKCFQRAFSCDVVERSVATASAAEIPAETPSRTCRSQELEMTYVENECCETNEECGENDDDAMKNKVGTTEGAVGGSNGSLDTSSSSSTRDAGIVCSDEDLRYILTEVTSQSKRMSVEAKREKMKSNRSLSLDSSSFFKLHMKRLQADSPAWLSRILNQRGGGNGSGGAAVTSPTASMTVSDSGGGTTISLAPLPPMSVSGGASNNDLARKRSISKKPEVTPETIAEDPSSSFDDDLGGRRRESTGSCGSEDDERSLLLANNPDSPIAKERPLPPPPLPAPMTSQNVPSPPPPPLQSNQSDEALKNDAAVVASKVAWNESSVVDAEILGTAIEFYLTSVNTRKPSGGGVGDAAGTCARPEVNGDNSQTTNGVSVPVVSTLKGLFVK